MEENIAKTQSPLKEMPECWQNDVRMNVLFAPFRKRDVNPLDYDSKMRFWKQCFMKWLNDKNRCSFSISLLQQEFQRNGRSPVCLGTVVEDLLRNGDIILKSDFLKLTPSHNQSWASWTVNLVVKTPVSWAFDKMKNAIITETFIDSKALYVHFDLLKKKGEQLLNLLKQEQEEKIFNLDRIKELLKTNSDESIELIVHWLELQSSVSVAQQSNITLIKVINDKDTKNQISEADLAVFAMKRNERALIANIEQLEVEKQNAELEARNYLKKGMRQMAKSCLRKKKALEKYIDKRATVLENIQLLLTRVQEAESDSKVLESYKMGLSAMKLTFKETGLSEDGVSNTMSQVQEALDVHEEIQASLAEPVDNTIDADLESELAELLANASSVPQDTLDKSLELPDVPTSVPSAESNTSRLHKQKIFT